jgi:voltage-gated potassium channel
VVIGAGRLGRAAARALGEAGLTYRVVERDASRIRDPETYVQGDAADLAVLQRAGISEAAAAVVTTHDDDINVYLTLYCRRLRPEAQVIARANLDRNVTTLHRAGADFVLSYASTGATAIWNLLTADTTLQLAEGLDVFRLELPPSLAGKALASSGIRSRTGCNVVAVIRQGRIEANPDPFVPLEAGTELVLIGDTQAEQLFRDRYPGEGRRRHAKVRTAPPPPGRGSGSAPA